MVGVGFFMYVTRSFAGPRQSGPALAAALVFLLRCYVLLLPGTMPSHDFSAFDISVSGGSSLPSCSFVRKGPRAASLELFELRVLAKIIFLLLCCRLRPSYSCFAGFSLLAVVVHQRAMQGQQLVCHMDDCVGCICMSALVR